MFIKKIIPESVSATQGLSLLFIVKEALESTGVEPVGGAERLLSAAAGSSILQSAVEEVTRVSIQVTAYCILQCEGF